MAETNDECIPAFGMHLTQLRHLTVVYRRSRTSITKTAIGLTKWWLEPSSATVTVRHSLRLKNGIELAILNPKC